MEQKPQYIGERVLRKTFALSPLLLKNPKRGSYLEERKYHVILVLRRAASVFEQSPFSKYLTDILS